jgi:hypothetical protein
MMISGNEKLIKQMKSIPATVRGSVAAAVRKATEETANVARTLAPVGTGNTKSMIFTKYQPDGMEASVEAAPSNKTDQPKVRSIEFGRKKGNKGTTEANPYIRRAQAYTAKKFKAAVRRAISKGLRDATNG